MIRQWIERFNTAKVWNRSLPTFIFAVVLVSGKLPIDAALASHPGFIPAFVRAVYDGFVTWFGWPFLTLSVGGLAVGKPPLPLQENHE